MNAKIASIDRFHQKRLGKLAFGAVELLVAYALISRAIDTGSLWEWLGGFLLIIGGINNIVRILAPKVKKDETKPKKR